VRVVRVRVRVSEVVLGGRAREEDAAARREGVQRLGRLRVLVLEPVCLVAYEEVALVLAPVEELLMDAEGLVTEYEYGSATRREAAHHLHDLHLRGFAHGDDVDTPLTQPTRSDPLLGELALPVCDE